MSSLDKTICNLKSKHQICYCAALAIVVMSCGSSDWTQFHGGELNAGYISVHSSTELTPKWRNPFFVGNVSYSSPAIASDGTIYLGTTTGALVAIKNDGSGFNWVFQTFDRFTNPGIVSSPSIGVHGDIYFTVSYHPCEKCFAADHPCDQCFWLTSIIKLGSDGTFKGSFELSQFPLHSPYVYTTASPKVLDWQGNDFIFVAACGRFFVLDGNLNINAEANLNCSGDLIDPNHIDFQYALEFIDRFNGPSSGSGPHFFDIYRDADQFWIDPTVAVIKKINGEERPTVLAAVATNGCGLECFEWNPPPINTLSSKWFAPRTAGDLLSSPSVSENGEVLLGTASGYLFSYDMVTGKHNWIFKAQEPLVATPLIWGGTTLNVFAVGQNNVFHIQNGQLSDKFPLPAKTQSSCAGSMDRIIISSQAGVFLVNYDFTKVVSDLNTKGGMSSPAIASDGTMYVVTNNGYLMAYQ